MKVTSLSSIFLTEFGRSLPSGRETFGIGGPVQLWFVKSPTQTFRLSRILVVLGRIPLLLESRCLSQTNPEGDSATKPKVARNEVPWGTSAPIQQLRRSSEGVV